MAKVAGQVITHITAIGHACGINASRIDQVVGADRINQRFDEIDIVSSAFTRPGTNRPVLAVT